MTALQADRIVRNLNPTPLNPSKVVTDCQCYEVGFCITVDGFGDHVSGRMVVATGVDLLTYERVYSWELRPVDGTTQVLDQGQWVREYMAAWEAAAAFLADPAKIIVKW